MWREEGEKTRVGSKVAKQAEPLPPACGGLSGLQHLCNFFVNLKLF